MLIFVYGEDSFRVQEKVKTLRDAFVKKFDPTSLNVSVFPSGDTNELDPAAVLQAARSMPFLSPKRLVIVQGLFDSVRKEKEAVWKEGLIGIPDTTVCIVVELTEGKAVEKHALFKALKEKAADVHVYSLPLLSGAELARFATTRVRERGSTIGREALQGLLERVGEDSWQLDQEIAKLTAFSGGKMITVEMVEKLVSPSFEGEIFALMDAVSQKRAPEALRKLQTERAAGANDMYLLTMLARQVRLLIGARAVLDENPSATSQTVAQELGIHPFVAGKVLAQARGFTLVSLREAHEALFRFDVATKSGLATAEESVDLVTTKLVQG
jgi:DNA polymerase-3 subunit delta